MRATCAMLVFLSLAARSWAVPAAWNDASTLHLGTVAPGEAEHWFPVWFVILDDQVYVRLGTRAAERIERNANAPWVGVRIGGRQFDRVRAEAAPEQTGRVAAAMAEKYWLDVLVRHANHPLTLRLFLDEAQGTPRQ